MTEGRLQVRSQIIGCSNCDLNIRCTSPVPFAGPSPTDVAVVGEAPSIEDDASGIPFSGPDGQLLKDVLAEAGLQTSKWMWMNVVSCRPVAEETLRTRIPVQHEINACSANLADQLQISDAQHVLLVGNTALQIFRPELRIGKAHGRSFYGDGRIFFSIYNPTAVQRNPAWKADLKTDVSLFGKVMAGDGWGPETCVICEGGVGHWDRGIPYCNEHWRQRDLHTD